MVPVQAVGALVFREDGRVLVVERAHPPMAGAWSLPGGHIRGGEAPARAIEREVLEETGLRVEAKVELEVVRIEREGYVYDIHEYLCTLRGDADDARAGDDAKDVRWVASEDLEALGVSAEARRVIARAAGRSEWW